MKKCFFVFMVWLGINANSLAFATQNNFTAYFHQHFVSNISERLVSFVHKTVDSVRYTSYKFGGSHFDLRHGTYVVDCSNYVDHILQAVSPRAYYSLVNSSGAEAPNSEHYYDFFKGLPRTHQHAWNKIDNVKELEPGDILVFRYQKNRHSSARGHVMVVMDKPKRDLGAFSVQVADSAPSGHSDDTRQPHHSGIGIGTLRLKVNPRTGAPDAYAWREGSCWKKNVHFAMARPLDPSV